MLQVQVKGLLICDVSNMSWSRAQIQVNYRLH